MLLALAWSALVVATAIMLAFPRTPAARALHRELVERASAFLLDFTWRKLGRVLLIALVLPVLVLAGPEMLAIFAILGGDAAAIELMIVVSAMSVSGGLAASWRQVRAAPVRLLRVARAIFRTGGRSRAPRNQARRRRPPKDDSSLPELAYA